MAQRGVPPNRWYGLRLQATFADETVWYDANAATGRDMMALGAVFTSFALLRGLLPGVTDVTYAITCALALMGATVVLTMRWIRLAIGCFESAERSRMLMVIIVRRLE